MKGFEVPHMPRCTCGSCRPCRESNRKRVYFCYIRLMERAVFDHREDTMALAAPLWPVIQNLQEEIAAARREA